MATKQTILTTLHTQQVAIRQLGVKRLSLFGSYVRNEQTSRSDVDLLVEFEPQQKTFDNFMALAEFLEDVLQQPVDLLTFESLSPHIKPRVLKELEDVPFTN